MTHPIYIKLRFTTTKKTQFYFLTHTATVYRPLLKVFVLLQYTKEMDVLLFRNDP